MATTVASTAVIVNQAIKTGSCGSSVLRTKLEAKREQIASLFCLQATKAGKFNAREQYLRVLLEVLKLAILDAAYLVDTTEATDNANRSMDQRTNSSRNGEMQETRQGNTTTEMRSCGFRNWDRHRTGDDESDSVAISKSRANSYSFYRDASASKSASGEEGFGENDQQSEMAQLGRGTTEGTRVSSKVSHIKPKEEGDVGGAFSDVPVQPSIAAEMDGCGATDWWIPSVGNASGNVGNFVNCISSAINFAAGLENYAALNIREESGFRKTGIYGIAASAPLPVCYITADDNLCQGGENPSPGRSLWEARVAALPETFTNYYSGNFNFEFSASISALGTGVGFSARFNLQAGETFSQSAKIDQGYDEATSRTLYCSDSGTLSAQKGRSENFSESAAQTKNDKRRRSEKSSESGSTLAATSIGTMRFSGKSKSGMDRSFSRIGNNTMQKTGLVEEVSTASLVDTSKQKMESITRYRHQIAKMLEDLMKKTLDEIEQLHAAKGRKTAPQSTAPAMQYRYDTPMGRAGARYASRTFRHPYPLFPASTKISE